MVKKNDSSSSKQIINRGAWTVKEDKKLADYINTHGERKWRSIPARAGLNRCGKSCRLRWLNYLRPGIKRGNISEDEEDLIIRLHNLLGNRWSLIAGRIPGRTDNEIKNHWNTHLSKKSLSINDLNLKLNQKLETTQVPLPVPNPSGAQVFPTPPLNAGEISQSCNEFQSLNCVEILRPWNELLEKDFDVNEFFDFPDSELPGTDPLSSNQDKVQEERSKLKEFHVDGMYENLLNTELQGSSGDWGEYSTEHDKCDEFDINILARLLDYDEDDMLNSFCTYGR